MARPRKLTDEQRLENNAARQKRWRDKNRVVEKLRSRNNRKKAMGVEDVVENPDPVKDDELISINEAEGWRPPVQIFRPVVQASSPVQGKAEKEAEEWLKAKLMQKKF